jgi:hypothetical protein
MEQALSPLVRLRAHFFFQGVADPLQGVSLFRNSKLARTDSDQIQPKLQLQPETLSSRLLSNN